MSELRKNPLDCIPSVAEIQERLAQNAREARALRSLLRIAKQTDSIPHVRVKADAHASTKAVP